MRSNCHQHPLFVTHIHLFFTLIGVNIQLVIHDLYVTYAGYRALLSSDELQQFDRVRVFLDEDFTAIDQFTVSTKTKRLYVFI